MRPVSLFASRTGPLRILALGAHADDIEIGCGGTILRLIADHRSVEMTLPTEAASGVEQRDLMRQTAQPVGVDARLDVALDHAGA